jgi:hypothetical protein
VERKKGKNMEEKKYKKISEKNVFEVAPLEETEESFIKIKKNSYPL